MWKTYPQNLWITRKVCVDMYHIKSCLIHNVDNVDNVENLSPLSVENLYFYTHTIRILYAYYTHMPMINVEIVENLSTEIVENSLILPALWISALERIA
jgi:hypothetical protein